MKKKLRKELIEWSVILTVLALLVTTGLGAKVASVLQQGLLQTGLMKPDILEDRELKKAEYTFSLTDTQGATVPFSDFRGKTIFINFWATWCPPCIAEMPDINELYEEMKDNDEIVFVLISVDKERENALAYVDKKSFDFPIYFLKTKPPAVYDTKSIPTTYVISPEGKIVAERHGMAKYNTESFRSFLKEL
ncbi:MAG: TlpA disulfide reductase family protein [Cyclobacteriaceae bacterium]